MKTANFKEKAGKTVFTIAAMICVIAVIAIFGFMLVKSLPAFRKIGFFNFVFGDNWSPDRLDKYDDASLSGTYGVFKMIIGTLAATVGALVIGGTLGYFTAVFIAFYCPERLKKIFSSTVNLLAGIPSVVYGFFGITFPASAPRELRSQQRQRTSGDVAHSRHNDYAHGGFAFQNEPRSRAAALITKERSRSVQPILRRFSERLRKRLNRELRRRSS